ncbi:MAG: hypothetical protein ACRDA4_08180 [Filifactoraceae bacterium]
MGMQLAILVINAATLIVAVKNMNMLKEINEELSMTNNKILAPKVELEPLKDFKKELENIINDVEVSADEKLSIK